MAQDGSPTGGLQVGELYTAEPKVESGLPYADYDWCAPLCKIWKICKAHSKAVSIWVGVEWSSYTPASLKISLGAIFQALVEKSENDGCIKEFI